MKYLNLENINSEKENTQNCQIMLFGFQHENQLRSFAQHSLFRKTPKSL